MVEIMANINKNEAITLVLFFMSLTLSIIISLLYCYLDMTNLFLPLVLSWGLLFSFIFLGDKDKEEDLEKIK